VIRALIDANVLISVLLSPSSTKPPVAIIDHAFERVVDLLVSETTIKEFRNKVATKPYLASRLTSDDVEAFISILTDSSTILPELREEIPTLSRDRKDDYLLLHAVASSAEFLVTGDKDLLVLEQIDETRIVSPAEFMAILDAESGA
jgi:putative PIN family toxin of toxin-antitoxin system